MKRTTTVGTLSALVLLSSAIAIGNGVAFHFGGQIDLFFSDSQINYDSEEAQQALTEGKELAQEICQNGNVLLKNINDCLPLAQDAHRVNIFGWGACDNGFMYQGGGSSEGGYSQDKISLYNAFRNNGFEINEDLAKKYNDLSYRREGAPDQNKHSIYYRTYEPGEDFYDSEMMNDAVNFSDTAIVTLSRRATEGDDLPKVSYDELGKADESRNYLALTKKEELMINKVTENFDKVIVLINSPAPMEMGFLDNPKIDAAMYVGYPGCYGAMAIPQILSGEVNPSGHMSDTSAYKLSSAPSYVNSGQDATMSYKHTGRYKDYAEDIYVGYKWYETADEEGFFDNETLNSYGENKTGYNAVVQYPFGFGLSYTNFSWTLDSVTNQDGQAINPNDTLKQDDILTYKVWVENTGDVPGKDVVELYYSAPYKEGEIEKSALNLIDFKKTGLLEPGKGETLTFEVRVSDMASYDTYDKNNNGFMGYELDGGDYSLSFRTDSHTIKNDKNELVMDYKYSIPSEGYKIENDPITGTKVENRFTNYTNEKTGATSTCQESQVKYKLGVDGNDSDPDYNQGIKYLTRSDFKNTFPKRTEQLLKMI